VGSTGQVTSAVQQVRLQDLDGGGGEQLQDGGKEPQDQIGKDEEEERQGCPCMHNLHTWHRKIID
jgi:hypothetical protein